jgi:hypothetical protein
MDDAGFVRGLERIGDLARDRQRFGERDGTALNAVREVLAPDQLHDERHVTAGAARRVLEAVDLGDVGMIQGGQRPRLALEAGETLDIHRERAGENLQRHVAPEPRIPRAIHLAHSAGADRGDDLVRAETGTDRQSHRLFWCGDILPGLGPRHARRRDALMAARRHGTKRRVSERRVATKAGGAPRGGRRSRVGGIDAVGRVHDSPDRCCPRPA